MEIDIISSLLKRGSYHHILINILVHLDIASLQNVACVCREWAVFISKNVTNNSYFISRRQDVHVRTKTPSIWVIACGQYVSCIKWDEEKQ